MRVRLLTSLSMTPLLLFLVAILAGCSGSRSMVFASDPPGARVVIDEADSGFVTPCTLHLDNDPFRVDFVLPGFLPATRYLDPATRMHWVFWRDSLKHFNTWAFPLFLNYRDFFVPVDIERGPEPRRLFVRLRRQADR